MFIIFLRFSDNKPKASEFMPQHNQWIQNGFDKGIFLLVGSLQDSMGGGIIAHNISRDELQQEINNDPFVKENIVTAEIIEISPAKFDERLGFIN